jgi:hypothetical protein
MNQEDVITWEGLRNGIVLGLVSWAVLIGVIYVAWTALTS